jgi:signal transduction histidine kinase
LLAAFLLVGLTPSVILTYLAYVQSRNALQREIETSLDAQAITVSSDVDHMLFERLQNALSWNRLEVMQDIRINDVDKRLSHFLGEVKSAYGGFYDDLYCVDPSGRIVAASRPQLVGRTVAAEAGWLPVVLPNGTVTLDGLRESGTPDSHRVLPIRAGIDSSIDGRSIGELVLLFDWRQIDRILDGVARDRRTAVVLDADGRIIAASAKLRARGVLLQAAPRDWLPPAASDSGTVVRNGSRETQLVGYKRSRGLEHFPGLHWTTLVLQPSAAALAPVRWMRLVFIGLLLATLLLTAVFASLVSAHIAGPITRLTDFTRRFAREHRLPPLPASSRGEVGELTETFVNTVRDLDRSREDFLRASKLAVAGEIAATMAHEIRTPLGILRSSAQILKQETGISAEGRELVAFVESETERINRLVTSVLDSANPRPPVMSRNNVGTVVHACVVMLGPQAEKKRILIEEHIGAGNLDVDCDVEQLTQVILNLLLNAVQLLADHGRVAATCRDIGDDGVIIEVADDGPGIPEAERAQIFEPFVSKRRGGLGLGLAVVKQIVSLHQGSIQILESGWGGALFSIRLPRRINP